MQRRQSRKSLLGTHREYHVQLLPDPVPKSTKSMLGTHRDHNVQLLPDSFPRGSKNTVPCNYLAVNFKSVTVKPPRKSMLGTRKVTRDGMLPFSSDPVSTFCHNTSTLNRASTNDETISNDDIVCPSLVDDSATTCKNSVLSAISEPSLVDTHGSRKSTFTSEWTSCMSNDPVFDVAENNIQGITTFGAVTEPADKNTSLFESTSRFRPEALLMASDSVLSSTLDMSTPYAVPDSHLVHSKRLDVMFSPESNDDSFIEHETMMANANSVRDTTVSENNEPTNNENSFLTATLKDTPEVANRLISSMTIEDISRAKPNSCDPTSNNAELNRMLILMDTWIERNIESVNSRTKQLRELQQRIDDTNKETAEIETMKQVLIATFKPTIPEKENVPEKLESLSVAPYPFRDLCQLPAVANSPSRQVMQEMRSTIKFLKTPCMSQASRRSVMLTPHSMSFSIKSQFEQLLN